MTDPADPRGAAGLAPGAAAKTQEPAQLRELRVQRNLKILVIGLGVLILAGLGAVIFQVIRSGSQRNASLNAAPQANAVAIPGVVPGPGPSLSTAQSTALGSGQGAGNIDLELPQGARVVSVSISGNRLAVHHESAFGTGIAVIDLDTGRRIANVNPREAAPRASK